MESVVHLALSTWMSEEEREEIPNNSPPDYVLYNEEGINNMKKQPRKMIKGTLVGSDKLSCVEAKAIRKLFLKKKSVFALVNIHDNEISILPLRPRYALQITTFDHFSDETFFFTADYYCYRDVLAFAENPSSADNEAIISIGTEGCSSELKIFDRKKKTIVWEKTVGED
jgi:hypothetical protein